MTPSLLMPSEHLAVSSPKSSQSDWFRAQLSAASHTIANPAPLAETGESKSAVQPREWLSHVADAGIKHLSDIVKQLITLRQEGPEDEYGILRPTDFAFEAAVSLLIDCAIELSVTHHRKMPRGCASSDSEGGIRIEWVRPQTSVHLAIPAQQQPRRCYIYHEDAGDFGVEHAVSAKELAVWLARVEDEPLTPQR